MKASRIKEWIDDKNAWYYLESAILGNGSWYDFEKETGFIGEVIESNNYKPNISNGDDINYIIDIEGKLFRWTGTYNSLSDGNMESIRDIKEVIAVAKTVISYETVEE